MAKAQQVVLLPHSKKVVGLNPRLSGAFPVSAYRFPLGASVSCFSTKNIYQRPERNSKI